MKKALTRRARRIGTLFIGQHHSIAAVGPVDLCEHHFARRCIAGIGVDHLVAMSILFLGRVPGGDPVSAIVQPGVCHATVDHPGPVTLSHHPVVLAAFVRATRHMVDPSKPLVDPVPVRAPAKWHELITLQREEILALHEGGKPLVGTPLHRRQPQ